MADKQYYSHDDMYSNDYNIVITIRRNTNKIPVK